MKKSAFNRLNFSSILLAFLVATSSSSDCFIQASVPSEIHSANAIWIEPSNLTIKDIGDKFNITVFINITQVSFAWQIKLYFNSTVLMALKTGYTCINGSEFFSEYPSITVTPIINNEEGYILHGESLLSNDEKASGYGSLIWIEFNLTQIPTQNDSTVYFSIPYGIDTFILTPYIDIIPMDSMNGAKVSIKTTNLPPFPDIITLIIITIIIGIVVGTLVLLNRKRRRKKKDFEEQEN
ncbi:MAG: hypothetical protein EAX86_11115 [Candidatus Heimdallarchaeota archaeon]|nr:hypothetical protein [Candidatus Heimdallarchaeota archaeon]